MITQIPVIRRMRASSDLPLNLRLSNQRAYLVERLKGSPLPPAAVMHLVQGNYDANYFVAGGLRGFQSVRDTLEKSYVQMDSLRRVLDFGCGCGRVLRHWKPYARNVELHGTDFNLELVLWCRKVAPFASIQRNQLAPPLTYQDNTFDFIYALSTFTHWTEPLQKEWMREFHRILRPGGHLMFTVHGDYYIPFLVPELREHYLAGRAVTGLERVGTNDCSAYNPPSQVVGELIQEMQLVGYYPRSALGNPWQDVYLVQKP
jgi:SAM-dependent methyltransferase